MPTCPQGVIAFYAANRLGAVPVMIHPLSTPAEVEQYLTTSRARCALVLDAIYDRFAPAPGRTGLETVILARISDYLGPVGRAAFWMQQGRKIPPVARHPALHWWKDLMGRRHPAAPAAPTDAERLAAILFSGGPTGTSKGIMLSNRNVVSEGLQVAAWVRITEDDAILAALPLFHGIGLAVCVNGPLLAGCAVHLVPTFNAHAIARLMHRARPTLMVGVPTLFAALMREPAFRHTDLSSLRAAFCGADALPRPVKERFERLVADRGGTVRMLEGSGLSEAVAGEMAAGALARSGADASVAITGIAGPTGGTPTKPVGLVWFAWAHRGGPVQCRRFVFAGDREAVRRQSVAVALQGLVDLLG